LVRASFDILGLGNAIVDVIARADDKLLGRLELAKGTMTLIDTARAQAIYEAMGPGVESSGGSAANSCAVAAAIGAKVAFVGQVADDQLGQVFGHDIRAAGVAFDTPPAKDGPPTARCLILVTQDAQRTMCTYLGACVNLSEAAIVPDRVQAAAVTYMEGYLFDPPAAQAAFRKAAALAHQAGRLVSLTLSDPFCVDRHRDAFRALVKDEVDILFANEAEILSLYQVEDFADALAAVRAETRIACLTRSEQGSVVATPQQLVQVAAVPTSVVDTTGAGDAYAAGFLAGFTQGKALSVCGRMASVAAAEAISHVGARPQGDLKALMAGV
jgi:sugar/nucleoside kinase (ribokinase family)